MTVIFDTETLPIARGRLAPPIVCMSWVEPSAGPQLALWRDAAPLLHAWLERGETFVGANVAYDFACIAASDPELRALVRDAYAAGRVRDVQVDGKLLDIAAGRYERAQGPGGGWSLEALAKRAGMKIAKDEDTWRLRFGDLANVPVEHWPAGAREYALADAEATYRVHLAQEAARAEWQAEGLDPLLHAERTTAKAYYLHRASCWGIPTDPRRVADIRRRAGAYRQVAARRLERCGLVRGNDTRDTKAAARLMIDRCLRQGREIPRTAPNKKGKGGYDNALKEWHEKWARRAEKARTPKALAKREAELMTWWYTPQRFNPALDYEPKFLGGVQLDRDQCILSGSRVLELYAEYTGTGTLWSRVENMANGFELPLQTRFDPIKETLRTSSTQPEGALIGEQMQNFPRASGVTPAERKRERGYKDKKGVEHKPEFFVGLRECFRPRPGNVFVGADYSMAELHTLAQTCLALFGQSEMAKLLNAGTDVHWYFAGKSLGLTIEQVKALPDGKRHRDRAKPLDFGIPGGMGPDKIILYSRKGYGVRFERDEVVRLRNLWLDETFPEVRHYFAWISRQLRAAGGERFTHVHPITRFVRGGCGYTSGANHGFQHLCAIGAGDAVAAVGIACETPGSPLFGFSLVNFVHDELILEGPEAAATEAAEELQKIMEREFNKWVPDVPTHAEPFITHIWSKQVKSVRDVGGRLIPWQP